MQSSFLYHAAIAVISRQVVLRSRPDAPFAADSLGFLEYYLKRAKVVVLGSKKAIEMFPGALVREHSKTRLVSACDEFWFSEDDGDYRRGDICFYSSELPAYEGLVRSYESRVLWNYSAVVNRVVEKWTQDAVGDASACYLVQHTNRIAGSDYLLIKASLRGMVDFCDAILRRMQYKPWTENASPVDSALSDVEEHWSKKWFMHANVLSESMAALRELAARPTN